MKQLILSNILDFNNISTIGTNFKNITSCVVMETPKDWIKNGITEFISEEKDKLINWICNGVVGLCDVGCVVCVAVCGLAILWFIIDQKGSTPKKYISGSYIFYLGMRLVQFVIS